MHMRWSIRSIILSLTALCATAVTAASNCAGYLLPNLIPGPFGSPREVVERHDLTGDGVPDEIRSWAAHGSAIVLSCTQDKRYTPVYSHGSLWGPESVPGIWSGLRFDWTIADLVRPDRRTWIDGILHLFARLPLHSDAPSGDDIFFADGRYRTDLTECPSLRLRAPAMRSVRRTCLDHRPRLISR